MADQIDFQFNNLLNQMTLPTLSTGTELTRGNWQIDAFSADLGAFEINTPVLPEFNNILWWSAQHPNPLTYWTEKKPGITPPPVPTATTIGEIHKEWESAAERLLEETNRIISEGTEDQEKVGLLTKFGFTKTKQYTDCKSANEKILSAKELARTIEKYRERYPSNKFVTDEIIEQICKKYDLVLGDVSQFKGFVPMTKLMDMDKFKVRNEDAITKSTYAMLNPGKQVPVPFKICAPIKDMDTRGYVQKGHIMFYDPVVLQPVHGGYLIVAMWGDEANDELLK